MKTVIYARYSAGSKQTEQSIEGQIRVCKDFCRQKGLEVVDEYVDRHISGRTDERPAFQQLITDAKKKKFEAVCVYKTDRFARNKYDSAIYKRELKRCGVRIYYAAETIPEGPEGIILESLMEGLAEYYSAELAQKIKRGMNESAHKCQSTGPGCPLGYVVGEDKRYHIDQNAAQIVRTIFDMYIRGETKATIRDYINDRGMKTKRGNDFGKSSIDRIIKNRKYIGEYRYGDIVVPGGMPAIVDEEVFTMAQAEIARRRTRKTPRSAKAEYLLSGKLFCGHCKAPMVGVSGTSKTGEPYYYYYCPNRRGKIKDCEKKQVRRDWLEDLVVDLTQRYILQNDVLEDLVKKVYALQELQNDPYDEIEFYNRKLTENKKASKNVLQAIENGVSTQTLPARLKELEDERAVIEGEIAFLNKRRPELSEDQIRFMLLQYADQKEEETSRDFKRRLISCFVSEVYLWNDKLVIFFNICGPDGKLKSVDLEKFDQRDVKSTNLTAGRTPALVVLPYGFVLKTNIVQKS